MTGPRYGAAIAVEGPDVQMRGNAEGESLETVVTMLDAVADTLRADLPENLPVEEQLTQGAENAEILAAVANESVWRCACGRVFGKGLAYSGHRAHCDE